MENKNQRANKNCNETKAPPHIYKLGSKSGSELSVVKAHEA